MSKARTNLSIKIPQSLPLSCGIVTANVKNTHQPFKLEEIDYHLYFMIDVKNSMYIITKYHVPGNTRLLIVKVIVNKSVPVGDTLSV